MLKKCSSFHYGLVSLYVRIQTAAAYAMLDKQAEAIRLLYPALREAEQDGLALPFAENYRYLAPLLQGCPQDAFFRQVTALGAEMMQHCGQLCQRSTTPAIFAELSEREREICTLIAARLTNREIGEKLYLSEGSIKQYSNQIYSKLQIGGDTRTKRKRLIDLLNSGS